jgi:hypothetical protein
MCPVLNTASSGSQTGFTLKPKIFGSKIPLITNSFRSQYFVSIKRKVYQVDSKNNIKTEL